VKIRFPAQGPDLLTQEMAKPEFRLAFNKERATIEFQEQIQSALDQDGVSRKQFAEQLGKSPAFVSQVLQHGRNLTVSTMAELADACGCELHILLRRRGARS
jgi:antitoxin component HigA of HigAB toxin-antitoxin module